MPGVRLTCEIDSEIDVAKSQNLSISPAWLYSGGMVQGSGKEGITCRIL